jgi:hypothetical protein
MRDYTLLKTFKRDGFDIIVDKTWEDIPLSHSFDDPCHDVAEMQRKVDNYDLDWFMLRVRVLLDGHKMAVAYVGGCLYENAEDVLTDGTAEYCIEEAMQEALDEVLRLRNKLNQLLVDIQYREPV